MQRVQAERAKWPSRIAGIEAKNLVFVDESGITTEITRRYGRVEGGQRLNDSTPASWQTLTVLGAVGIQAWVATMTIEAATDTDVFLAFLDHALCPKLKPGDVVIMDNLSSHKVEGVWERITAAGAELLYLPPYSPDFNPIEKCWAQMKQHLRTAMARTITALDSALDKVLAMLTTHQAAAYFHHCGYNT